MKRPGLTPRLIAATLFLALAAGLRIHAQDMRPASGAANAAKRADDLLKRFDKNGDGKLDDDERADAKESMMKEQVDRQMARSGPLPAGLEKFRGQVLEMFDKNRDGRLDDDERLAAQKFAETHLAGIEDLNKRFDRNGDGKIDSEERAAIDAYLAELRTLGSGQMRTEFLRRFDRNADGRVDDSEMAELEKFVRPRVETTPEQLRRYDKNNDGMLDGAEWAVAREAIAQWLNASGPAALESTMLRDDRTGTPSAEAKRTPEQEAARLKAVADEVARRRALREAATRAINPPK